MLIEQSEDVWVVQVRASLTAFEYEVESNYGKDSYKTPEEFKTLVLDHMMKNLNIKFNDLENVKFGNGQVKLGHETSVVLEVLNAPKSIESVKIKNLSFDDIYNSQSALIVLKKDFAKEQFMLSKANEYEAELEVGALKFELKPSAKSAANPSYAMLIFCGLLFFGLSALVYYGGLPLYYNRKESLEI
ncbi:hypothetical protein [Portibacter lacus]|uniref:Uncharacterized protein n=1 Tax=Portibacter lacus TaxID=1099794 RepID=A0AA37WCZ7_9BACT|nr:hypothetical protein [Portibacter lacus]GLR17306.1 hypothetical protein GCM10007940_19210 [Portibacter lacus]